MTTRLDLILSAQTLAALLFLFALWPFATVDSRRGRHAALAGTIILSAAAIYDMDVINGPEIIGALLVGGGVGLLLGRGWPSGRLMPLLTICTGCAAAAMLIAAAAVWLNPYAFGLIEHESSFFAARYLLALAGVALGGVGASACALTALFRRHRSDMLLLVLSIAMTGWSAAALAFLVDNVGLLVAGGLAGAAATGLALRICGGRAGRDLPTRRPIRNAGAEGRRDCSGRH